MTRLTSFIIFCLLLINASTAFCQPGWKLKKDKNQIKVYTAREPGEKYETIKVEAQLQGTLQKLLAILKDVPDTKNWVYATKLAYYVSKINELDFTYYTETSLPWPVSNRDIVIHMRLRQDGANALKVIANGEPDILPPKKGRVRVPFFYSTWDVKSIENNKLNIVYILKMNPGGSIPAGITNMFISKGPYETFNSLGELLRQ